MPETFKQVAEKINSSSTVLIVLPQLASADAVAAGLALSGYLKRLEKDAVIVSADGKPNDRVSFLPGFDGIMRELSLAKSFVINVSTRRAPISELSYKKEGDNLAIHLKAKSGEFTPEDVTFGKSKFPYDSVVVLGAQALDGLGAFYGTHAELFFETPVINIDFRGSNQGFGQFNLIELNASSISEIVLDLISQMERSLLDKDMATALLTGIISETNSFQHSRTTPQSFLKASDLVTMGASQQEIVTKLYKNKSMGFLKVWGRVLSKLKQESEIFLVHSTITRDDLEKSGASKDDSSAILKEMIFQLSFAKVMALFLEIDAEQTEVSLVAPPTINLNSKFSEFQPVSLQPHTVRFTVPMSMDVAQERVLSALRIEAQKLA